MAVDIAIDDDGGWLLNDEGDDLAIVTGINEMRQSITTELDTQEGTSIFDPTFGVPYREQILVRAPNLSVVASIIRGTILQRPDVQSVPTFTIDSLPGQREIAVEFEAITDEGVVNATTTL